MPYQYQLIDEVRLPLYNPSQVHDPAAAERVLVRTIGGYYDAFATEDANAAVTNHKLTGVYLGATTYLVDELGNRFVDEAGNHIIMGNGSTMLRAQLQALREKMRKRCTLWRVWMDDNPAAPTIRQWKTVRFIRMGQPQEVTDRMVRAVVTCEFEPLMPHMVNWRAETQTVLPKSASAGVATTIVVENPGETVNDARFIVTRTSGTITAIALNCDELGIGLQWTGSLGSGQTLEINDGNDSVSIAPTATSPLGGVDAYSGFGLSEHTAKSWLRLPQGMYNFTATVLGGNATVTMRFYPQFK